ALLLLSGSVAASVPAEAEPADAGLSCLVRHGDRSAMPLAAAIDPHSDCLTGWGPAQLLEQGFAPALPAGRLATPSRMDNQSLLPRWFNTSTMDTDTDRTLMSARHCWLDYSPDSAPETDLDVPLEADRRQTTAEDVPLPCAAYQPVGANSAPDPTAPSSLLCGNSLASRAGQKPGQAGRGRTTVRSSSCGEWRTRVNSWQRMGLAMPSWSTAPSGKAWPTAFGQDGPAGGSAVGRACGCGWRARLRSALQVYSAHDSTVAAFLHAFQVFNGLRPPMAAGIIAELYASGEFRLVYKNSTEQPAVHQLSIPFCPPPCFLPQLESEMRHRGVWAETAQAMCGGGGGDFAEDSQQAEPLGVVYNFILVIVLSVSWLPLLY
uniref:Lysosomal acid phosphatase n=1 Tax=Macrostomum lignano TaxID=282301 RepID=A0A1I8FN17_9PLAT